MAYTFGRNWYEKTECPFCSKGVIEIHHILPVKNENISTTVGGRRARTSHESPERRSAK
jgi:hypothetical protein